MNVRPRILFVAPVEPWCRENGSSLITADLLDAIAGFDDVEVLAIFLRRPPEGYDRHESRGLQEVLLDVPGLPRWASVLRAVLRASSPLRHRFDNARVVGAIRRVLEERRFDPDLVHVEHLPLVDIGLAVARPIRRPLVYRAHNIESRLWARRLGAPNALKAPIVRHMERLEVDAVRSTDLTLCISREDLEWARSSAPEVRSDLLPCTLRMDRYDAIQGRDPVFDAQVCFVGGMDWAPNVDGLRWFVLEVLPRITARVPEAGLAVLARGAEQVGWLSENPSIRVLPAAGGAAELFASSRISVAPLFQGGGVRVKIPESLAVGCPVVATKIGAEGHDLPGITRADEPAGFAEACVRHLLVRRTPEDRLAMRVGVEAHYDAKRHARRLVGQWSSVLAHRAPSGGPFRVDPAH